MNATNLFTSTTKNTEGKIFVVRLFLGRESYKLEERFLNAFRFLRSVLLSLSADGLHRGKTLIFVREGHEIKSKVRKVFPDKSTEFSRHKRLLLLTVHFIFTIDVSSRIK